VKITSPPSKTQGTATGFGTEFVSSLGVLHTIRITFTRLAEARNELLKHNPGAVQAESEKRVGGGVALMFAPKNPFDADGCFDYDDCCHHTTGYSLALAAAGSANIEPYLLSRATEV
jgi:hypothetical protein